ncbi:hypothetical protein Mp_4g20030 [Marchantia polymorpha subsp. ruderalis]|uniref:Uncharacterized protein n=2 Tax=Marchantia polymorpha TaxID=3197 RepID=A0AAF6BBU4_MARPO|nr:hypothetical protein MARPO_0116s0005 [Marchantia polymorpha]BBN09478.1 hypothetical protein Mp_4g20030 [Marchantia polymorpha subsp. ruderalis]|eukprot:PTQ31014.1 hypothetical protein MARPO_0116s0005 [Marchantia polymorpha]
MLMGLLPLKYVQELGFDKSIGYMWIMQKKKMEHTFKLLGKQVTYAKEIKGYVEKGKIRKLSGVKTNELFLWIPVIDIIVDGDHITFNIYGKGKIRKLSGVKTNELFLWIPVIDIIVDGDHITFKIYGDVNKILLLMPLLPDSMLVSALQF